jgi:dienelactone hydrolase
MHARRLLRRKTLIALAFLGAGAAALFVCASGLNAHVIIMKDGFTLKGTIKEEKEVIAEGGFIGMIGKLGGFKMVDDGARRMIFSHKQAQDVVDKDVDQGSADLHLNRPIVKIANYALPPGQYDSFTSWNAGWDRKARINTPTRKSLLEIAQHVSTLTPHYAYVQSRQYKWAPHYLTTEFDADSIHNLLTSHPDLKLNGGKDDAGKRFRIHRFLFEAGFYEAALAELDKIAADMPEQKDKVEKQRGSLRKILAGQLLDLVELAQKVGRHQWAQARLANFPQQDLDEGQLVRLRALQASYETVNKNLTQARHFLESLPGALTDSSAPRQLLIEAAAAINAELNPDTVPRLETFVSYARQAEYARERNQTPANPPDQLLSLAITGWLLGNTGAESKVESAVRLWQARQFFLQYQRANDVRDRQHLLAQYRNGPVVAFDELDQIVRTLPPTDPYELGGAGSNGMLPGVQPFSGSSFALALFTAYRNAPDVPLEFQANLPWSIRKGAPYLLQLPPEYHPGRAYPVLIVLHEAGERPEDMLKRWSPLAAQHGYLLVAPEWDNAGRSAYRYTQEEHRAVVEVLRDLRQHFQVDSDRVFLSGLGEGGNMAFDVGLAHPDLFAGVIPVGGRPQYFAKAYWANAQYLPFYVLDGDLDGPGAKDNRQQFQQWVSHGYPALFVQYKGRGSEWFPGELPYLFDWMSRKKRASGYPELGKHTLTSSSEDFQCMRVSDNYFYWLTGEELQDRFTNDSRSWRNSTGAATLQARLKDNDVHVMARGFKRVTVWLGQGMLDYEKPIKITLNQNVVWPARKYTPNLETLLEDFYHRGDRQRHFFAKIEIPL